MNPDPQYLVEFVVEDHRASNVIVGELEECLPDVRHWDLHGKVKGLDWSDSAGRAIGHSRDMGPTCKHVMALVGNVLQQVKSISFAKLNFLHQYGLALLKPQAVKKRHDMVSHGRPRSCRGSSLGKMLRLAQSGSESLRAQKVEPTGKGNREKIASTCQAAKKRGGEGAAITHWPC